MESHSTHTEHAKRAAPEAWGIAEHEYTDSMSRDRGCQCRCRVESTRGGGCSYATNIVYILLKVAAVVLKRKSNQHKNECVV